MSINMSSKFHSKIPTTKPKRMYNMSPIAIMRKEKVNIKGLYILTLNSLEITFIEKF